MAECLTLDGSFGNASSTGHQPGAAARRRVEEARAQVAHLIGAEPAGDRLDLRCDRIEQSRDPRGGALSPRPRRACRHREAPSTRRCSILAGSWRRKGFGSPTCVRIDDGIVAPDQVAEALTADTVLVSIMHVNNEIGVIQDIGSIGRLCRERGVLLHVDARAECRQDSRRCRCTARRSVVFHGAQVLWAQGQRRAVRAAAAASRSRAAHVRRRAGRRVCDPARSPTHQIVGLGRGVRDRERANWRVTRSASKPCARGSWPVSRRSERFIQRAPAATNRACAQRVFRRRGGRESDLRHARARGVDGVGLQFSGSGALVRPACARTQRCARARIDTLQPGQVLHVRRRRLRVACRFEPGSEA